MNVDVDAFIDFDAFEFGLNETNGGQSLLSLAFMAGLHLRLYGGDEVAHVGCLRILVEALTLAILARYFFGVTLNRGSGSALADCRGLS